MNVTQEIFEMVNRELQLTRYTEWATKNRPLYYSV